MARAYKFHGHPWLRSRFLLRLVGRALLFWRSDSNLARFFEQYAPDGAEPVPVDLRASFPAYQKCLVCSLCTFSCAAVREGTAPPAFEPKYLLIGPSRRSAAADAFVPEWVPCVTCTKCTVECPNGVPVHAAATLIVSRGKRETVSGASERATSGA